jgi:hypothetical protein
LKELSKYTNLDLVNSLEREENLNKNSSANHHKIDQIKCENFDEALQSENLSEIHEEGMPYKCLLCKAGFAKIEEITTHMNTFHENKSSKVYINYHIPNSKLWHSTFFPIFECFYWLPFGYWQPMKTLQNWQMVGVPYF